MRPFLALPLATLLLSSSTFTRAAADTGACAPSRLVIVLDRSSSMNGAAGPVTKWTAARAAIDQVTAAYQSSIELGLATFPYPDECGPGRLDVAPDLGNREAIHAALMTPPPVAGAWTPLGETLLVLLDEPALDGYDGPTHVVVISDGFQWCSPYDPDARTLPVVAAKALADEGVTTFVVGFGGGVDALTLDQMAVVAGTARAGCDPTGDLEAPCYYQADDAAALLAALMDIAAVAAVETCDDLDNDCDGVVDEDACDTPGADAGPSVAGDAGLPDGLVTASGGCGCASGAAPAPAAAMVVILTAAALSRRRRARARPRPARR